jgi:hypothetical protein
MNAVNGVNTLNEASLYAPDNRPSAPSNAREAGLEEQRAAVAVRGVYGAGREDAPSSSLRPDDLPLLSSSFETEAGGKREGSLPAGNLPSHRPSDNGEEQAARAANPLSSRSAVLLPVANEEHDAATGAAWPSNAQEAANRKYGSKLRRLLGMSVPGCEKTALTRTREEFVARA